MLAKTVLSERYFCLILFLIDGESFDNCSFFEPQFRDMFLLCAAFIKVLLSGAKSLCRRQDWYA